MSAGGPNAVQRRADPRPLILVTVGTDHHPFDRLVRWMDDWGVKTGDARVRILVQTGTSRPPAQADWRPYFAWSEMQSLMREATCVVCHGGPSTIVDCGRYGLRPIVVPRRRRLGEHVDDHQTAFLRWIADRQEVLVASSRERLEHLLDRALTAPHLFRTAATRPPSSEVVRRIGSWIEDLVANRTRPSVVARLVGRRSGRPDQVSALSAPTQMRSNGAGA